MMMVLLSFRTQFYVKSLFKKSLLGRNAARKNTGRLLIQRPIRGMYLRRIRHSALEKFSLQLIHILKYSVTSFFHLQLLPVD